MCLFFFPVIYFNFSWQKIKHKPDMGIHAITPALRKLRQENYHELVQ